MADLTLIIHGWSSSSYSFRKVKEFLVRSGAGRVESILYADYESREDNMTFNDVIDGLNDEMIRHGIVGRDGKKKKNVNVIVHSTGGMVIRHWIWRYYYRDGDRTKDCPVKRLIMLAPANFGSPLAHRGKSFFGGLMKGRKSLGNFLETGRQILDGLELGSPYQWDLAHRDLFIDEPYYRSDRIATTILVGIEQYKGLAGLVNKPGSDGVVVIAGTSLNSAKLTLGVCRPDGERASYVPCQWSVTRPLDDYAFGVLPGLDHTSIVGDIAAGTGGLVGALVIEALKKRPGSFDSFKKKLVDISNRAYQSTGTTKYQQFLLRAIDDQDAPIDDYTLEFFIAPSRGLREGGVVVLGRRDPRMRRWSDLVHKKLTREFHTHSRAPSHRRFLIAPLEVHNLLERAGRDVGKNVALCMRMHVPRIDRGIRYDTRSLQNIVLYDPHRTGRRSLSFFYPNTTTLLEFRVDRYNKYVTIGTRARKHS